MEKQNYLVAQRIKGLRVMMNLSPEEMASATDTSLSEYIDCEEGRTDPSFTFLYKCAIRFGVDLSELVMGSDPKLGFYTVSRKGDGMPIDRRHGFSYRHLAAMLKNRFSEPFVVTARYSEQEQNAPIELSCHNGQELDYVLEGSLKVRLDDHVEVLNPGDSVYYDAAHKHGMIAVGGKDCTFLAVVIKGMAEEDTNPVPVKEPKALANAQGDLVYRKFVSETLDENGCLQDIRYEVPVNFNFAYDVVDALAQKTPDKTAMVWVSREGEKRLFSFEDMSRYSAKVANYFKSLGIGKGDKVMVVLKRHYQFWFTILALHRLGAVAVPATHLLTKKDFAYRFNAAGIKAIVCTAEGDAAQAVDDSLPESPTVVTRVMVNGVREGWHSFDEAIAVQSDCFPRPEGEEANSSSDPMLMYFTSGTTGYPKIAMHAYSYPLGHVVTARWWHNVDPNGLHFTMSDTGWAKSMWGKLYGQWLCEAAIFTYDFDRFDADDILKKFSEYKITTFCAPPTIYRMFIKEDLSKYDFSSLKYATIAGEALNPEVFQQFYNHTGLKLMEGFGQTETTLSVVNLVGMEPKPGSMGKPNPQYDVELLDAEDKPAKVGEVGEIVIRTDKKKPCGMFQGYYMDEERTDAVWQNDIYHTGDMAWKDEEGYFWYVGRSDDLIKSSGYRIGPFEIESVLMELPYVLECAITGVPDPVRGQVVKATIVLTKDMSPSEQLKKDIQEYFKEHTAPYKYPRIIEFVEALPKTISGKIRRVELRNS